MMANNKVPTLSKETSNMKYTGKFPPSGFRPFILSTKMGLVGWIGWRVPTIT